MKPLLLPALFAAALLGTALPRPSSLAAAPSSTDAAPGLRPAMPAPTEPEPQPPRRPGLYTPGAIGGVQALTGDTIRFGKTVFRLPGLSCPDPATEAGRAAKALANTFLRQGGRFQCATQTVAGVTTGDCTARTFNGTRRLSEVIKRSGHCQWGEPS